MMADMGIGQLERQVIEAALVTTRSTSTSFERSEASSQLEQWTSSVGSSPNTTSPIDANCWEAYINIIRASFAGVSNASEYSSASSHGSVTPVASRQSSGCFSSLASASNNIVEQIAYATSPSKPPLQQRQQDEPISLHLQQQVQCEANGAKLLLLTLFCTKIRKEYIRLLREQPALAQLVNEELISACWGYFNEEKMRQLGQDDGALMNALCGAIASVAVRSSSNQPVLNEGVMQLISVCQSSIASSLGVAIANPATINFPASVAMKLLSDIPEEVQSRADLTTAETDAFLEMPFNGTDGASAALETLQLALSGFITSGGGEQQDAVLCLTLSTLAKWAEACKTISLSRLQDAQNGLSILSQLVALLSNQSHQKQWSTAKYAEDAIIQSARALNFIIGNTSDFGTQSRRAAVATLLEAIQTPTEFIVTSLKMAESQQWEDATVALSNLASTLAREEIDDIAHCQLPGCLDLIELLLELQSHPIHNVAVPVLEVWLALQDVPTGDRHPSMAEPLFMRLVEVILNRVTYPLTFVSWDEELEVESSDFEEMRRLCTDVLIGTYFLLRSAYLETLANVVVSTDSGEWEVVESALWCLSAVSREACARVKSSRNAGRSGRESPASIDGGATATGLTQVIGSLCAGGSASAARQHPLVLAGITTFLGSYSVVWSLSCPPQSILEILAYLASAISVSSATEAAGRSIRLLLISSASKLAKTAASPGADPSSYNQIASVLTQLMNSALDTGNANVMASVAEGCCRLSIQLKDSSQTQSILSAVAAPSIRRSRSALDAIIASSSVEGSGLALSQTENASQALASCLGVLRELVRFCDASSGEHDAQNHVLSDVLTSAWPVLNDIASHPYCRSNEIVLAGLLEVHSQLLGVVPALIGPYFNDLISFVVRSYEETVCPSSLEYISAAVESFGSENSAIANVAGLDDNATEAMFSQLLAHISQCTFRFVTQTTQPKECTQVIAALFKMTQRYLLFLPAALVQCSEFASLFALGVACLAECKGEVESTRSTLIFLSQLIGWKHLRLPQSKHQQLEQSAGIVDNLLLQHGQKITKACIRGLSGFAPQILWPSFSECLFSIMLHVSSGSANDVGSVLNNWLYAAMTDSSVVGSTQNITQEVGTSIVKILGDLAREGVKSKPRAKMLLTDFGKICNNETSVDILLSYSLS